MVNPMGLNAYFSFSLPMRVPSTIECRAMEMDVIPRTAGNNSSPIIFTIFVKCSVSTHPTHAPHSIALISSDQNLVNRMKTVDRKKNQIRSFVHTLCKAFRC